MDVNGTRFHLLLGRDWAECGLAETEYAEGTAELTLKAAVFRFDARDERGPALEDRRGAGCDRFGNWYWIDGAGTSILVNSAGTRTTSLFWRAGHGAEGGRVPRHGEFAPGAPRPDPATLALSGLAVTEDHYLVAGLLEPAGLLIFDLSATAPPRRVAWPASTFHPFDLAPRVGGGVWVLDREEGRSARLWQLNRHFLVVSQRSGIPPHAPGDFVPLEGGDPTPSAPAPRFGPVAVEDALELAGAAIAVERAPDGSVLVLERTAGTAPSRVRRIEDGVDTGSVELRDADARVLLPDGAEHTGVSVRAHDIALVAAPEPRAEALGSLFAVDERGNQAYRFELAVRGGRLEAALAREYHPLRMFGGKALVAGREEAYYDFDDRFVPLVQQHRPRYAAAGSVTTVHELDSHAPATVWHRLLLDACIPAETGVRVWTRAADDRRELPASEWELEPRPYLRGGGSELPFATGRRGQFEGTWELLFQRAQGRDIELRLELTGDGRSTPRLRALRAYYPRFSYLERYLPKVYREDPASASFLDRFLANLEGLDTALEDRVAAAQVLFDPRTAPPETLEWLARWFDFALDPLWSEARRRFFLRHALDFFRVRGTVRGLERALRLALDPPDCVDERLFDEPRSEADRAARIVERFRTRRAPAVVAGDPTGPAGPRVVPAGARWRPELGAEALHERWREAHGGEDDEFPLQAPVEGAEAWRAFAGATLGFEPSANPDLGAWRRFLRRRYGSVSALDDAYGLVGGARHASFEAVAFPGEVPAVAAALRDWFHFEAIVQPMRRSASRFTVLLPVPAGGGDEPHALTQEDRRELARRVVDLHKPAHTTFDVRFYWSAFRVGEARLGHDTLIELGSRSPLLLQSAVLGREHLGETTLGGELAPALTDPPSLGRNPVLR